MSSVRIRDGGLLSIGIVLLLIAVLWLVWLLVPPHREVVSAPSETTASQTAAPSGAVVTGAATDAAVGADIGAGAAMPWHSDSEFGVSQPGMALRRVVQMLQWREVATVPLAPGDEVLVDQGEYQMVWAGKPIDSSHFAEPQGHENPPMPPYRSRVFGAVPERVVDSDQPAPRWRRIPAARIQLPDNLASTFRIDGDWLVTAAALAAPEAGDLRLGFEVLTLATADDPDTLATRTADDGTAATATHSHFALDWTMRISALLLTVIAAALVQQGLRRLLPATSWLARASHAAHLTLALWCTAACLLLAALLARLF